jgi:hypothetical protein
MLPRSLREPFAGAIRRMMDPVVRSLIANGVPYPLFDQLVRELFVEVAERDFSLRRKRQTDSRVSLLTGLHRKEIARLRNRERAPGTEIDVGRAPITRLIGRWMAGPPYADKQGNPKPLRYDDEGARGPTFARLVRELAIDAPPRSVLDELVHIGAAERKGGVVVLRQQAHVPSGDARAKLSLLGQDPAEVFETILHNIENPDRPWLHRKVVYDNIGAEALAELREAARSIGEEFIRRANALLASRDRDRNPGAPGGRRSRIALGTYYFESEFGPPTEAEEAPASAPRARVGGRAGGPRSKPRGAGRKRRTPSEESSR